MTKSVILCIIAIFLSSLAYSAEIYVDGHLPSDCTNGNYSIANHNCTGLDGNAYKTVQEGINAATGGNDTVYIRAGTYQEIQNSDNYNEECFYIPSSSSGVTIKAYNNEDVTLTYDPNDIPIEENYAKSGCWDYPGPIIRLGNNVTVTFEDLKIAGFKDESGVYFSEWADVGIWSGSNNNTITVNRCKIYDHMHAAFKGNGQWNVYDSEIYNIGVPSARLHSDRLPGGNCEDGTDNTHGVYFAESCNQPADVRRNYFHDFGDSGNCSRQTGPIIQFRTPNLNQTHVLANNLFLVNSCGKEWPVMVTGNMRIHNNTLCASASGASVAMWGYANFIDIDMYNNIIWGFDHAVSKDSFGDCANWDHDYNMIGGSVSSDCGSWSEGNGYSGTDPNFISGSPSTWTDLRVSSNSSAIDNGYNLGSNFHAALDPTDITWPPSTLDQDWFPTGWEIGAFVFKDRPAPPQNLRIK